MAKRAAPELKAAIRRYHRDGWSYYALAKIVPYSEVAISNWCDGGMMARQKASSQEWHEKNRGKARAATKKWQRENKAHLDEYQAAYREANKERIRKRNREYHARNRAKRNAQSAAYRAANPEKMRQLDRAYRQANPDKNAAKAAKARADRAQATPPWLTAEHLKEIESFYSAAKLLEQAHGVKYDVDHIHPIKGKTCCGLHVPWNLQILDAGANRQKSNRLERDNRHVRPDHNLVLHQTAKASAGRDRLNRLGAQERL